MKIVAGVLIIVVAMMDLISGIGYTVGGGVVLFQGKAAVLVMGVGGLQILADIIGCALLKDVGVTNIFAIAVGAFVIFVGRTYLPKSAPPQPEIA